MTVFKAINLHVSPQFRSGGVECPGFTDGEKTRICLPSGAGATIVFGDNHPSANCLNGEGMAAAELNSLARDRVRFLIAIVDPSMDQVDS